MTRFKRPYFNLLAALLIFVSNALGGLSLGGLSLGCCCKRAALAGENCSEGSHCDGSAPSRGDSAESGCCSSSKRASTCCSSQSDAGEEKPSVAISDGCCQCCESKTLQATQAVSVRQLKFDVSESSFLPFVDHDQVGRKADSVGRSVFVVASRGRRQAQLGVWLN